MGRVATRGKFLSVACVVLLATNGDIARLGRSPASKADEVGDGAADGQDHAEADERQ